MGLLAYLLDGSDVQKEELHAGCVRESLHLEACRKMDTHSNVVQSQCQQWPNDDDAETSDDGAPYRVLDRTACADPAVLAFKIDLEHGCNQD